MNRALMYQGSGGGGMTSAPAQGVGTATEHGESRVDAPNIGMAMQVGQQMAMQQAQIDNLNADTKKKLADATATSGVQTDLARAQIQNYAANTDNTQAQTELTKVQTQIADVQKKIVSDTAANAIEQVNMTLQKTVQEVDSMVRRVVS